MEIFITGDTHGDFRRFRPDIFYEQEHMTKEDLVLVCGDFGGIWYGDPRDDAGLDWLEDRSYTTAFVLGNHENYDAYKDYPKEEWHGGQIQRIRPSVLHLMLKIYLKTQFYIRNRRRGWDSGRRCHAVVVGISPPPAHLALESYVFSRVDGRRCGGSAVVFADSRSVPSVIVWHLMSVIVEEHKVIIIDIYRGAPSHCMKSQLTAIPGQLRHYERKPALIWRCGDVLGGDSKFSADIDIKHFKKILAIDCHLASNDRAIA